MVDQPHAQPNLSGFLPATFVVQKGELRVRWLRCSPHDVQEPFLCQTEDRLIARALRGTVLETEVDALNFRLSNDCAHPAGFVFHTSHCGSTLLGNMLAVIPRHLVLSEPGALSMLLDGVGDRLGPDLSPHLPTIQLTLQATASWIAQRAEYYFIKFFSQSVHQIALIRRAAPEVPEIFLYRDPLEVVVGNLRDPTQSWIWHEKYTGLPLSQALERPVAELFARAVGRTMEAMLSHARESTLLLNYSELGPNTPKVLLDFLGIPHAAALIDDMAAVLPYDAKRMWRMRLFQRDVEQKRSAATSKVGDLVSQFAEPSFRRLEARRLADSLPVTAAASAAPVPRLCSSEEIRNECHRSLAGTCRGCKDYRSGR